MENKAGWKSSLLRHSKLIGSVSGEIVPGHNPPTIPPATQAMVPKARPGVAPIVHTHRTSCRCHSDMGIHAFWASPFSNP